MRQIDVVGAVIENEAGHILCARRSPHMAQGGLWEFPGGKIEAGESPAESLRREIREELGCEITVGPQVADVTYAYPDRVVRLITYRARLVSGQPTPREHAELRWLPPGELHRLTWAPADLPTVRRLQEEVHSRPLDKTE
ncbi:MAG TPA: (deoxy)nucleoside triphosphate pyrophosphohydrolase [Symbiobacteriaceae bacterium]